MFTALLFTIAKTWKQPKCPPIDEWLKKMWYTHTTEYLLSYEKRNLPTCDNMWNLKNKPNRNRILDTTEQTSD